MLCLFKMSFGNYVDSVALPPQKAMPPEPRVTGVYRLGPDSTEEKRRSSAGIGDLIVVNVDNLKTLLDRANCTDSTIRNCRKQDIRLFLDGRMISDLKPESGAPIKDKGELQFHLERNPDNDEAWADLFGAPSFGKYFFHRPTRVSVGLENEYAIDSDVDNFQLTRVRSNWFIACLLIIVSYLLLIFVLAKRSGLLRDRTMDISIISSLFPAHDDGNVLLRPYSLGRFQLAFWFSLVIICYLFIWLITGAYDIITPSVLGLIGISAGTSLGSAVIDDNKGTEVVRQTFSLLGQKQKLAAEIASLKTLIAANDPDKINLQSKLSENESKLAEIEMTINHNKEIVGPRLSKGFLRDILMDANGVSFHRLQMFVWTILLGLLFIYSVWARLSMPEFSATLLALQGITAGTYLGFKIPEKQPAA